MALKDKYRPVLELGEKLNVQNGNVQEMDGKLKIEGTTRTQYEKNLMWDKIKEIGGENPSDLMADIKVAEKDHFHKHTVGKGDSLSRIAQMYYGKGKAGKYMHIFNANKNIIKDPDMIHPGQELTIPFPDPSW